MTRVIQPMKTFALKVIIIQLNLMLKSSVMSIGTSCILRVYGLLQTREILLLLAFQFTHVPPLFSLSRHCGVLYVFNNQKKENGNEK